MLDLQDKQNHANVCAAGYSEYLESGISYTGIKNNSVLWCAGILPMWEGRGHAWALISKHVGPGGMIYLTRFCESFFTNCGINRIEAHVSPEFNEAIRWIELLKFKRETPEPMRKFSPTGEDMFLYARVN